jgi:hypothetical protein
MSYLTKNIQLLSKSLKSSVEDLMKESEERLKESQEFYEQFLKNLIRFFEKRISDKTIEFCKKFLGTTEFDFIAVDGTSLKDAGNGYVTFFGGAFGVRGKIELRKDKLLTKDYRDYFDENVCMVAYVPVPYSELIRVEGKEGEVEGTLDDEYRIDLSNIHNKVMQLAEIYLAYREVVRNSNLKLLLLDLSLSGTQASVSHSTEIFSRKVKMKGVKLSSGSKLRSSDFLVVSSHPKNQILDVPSDRKYTLIYRIIGILEDNQNGISLDELKKKIEWPEPEIEEILKKMEEKYKAIIRENGKIKLTNPNSWSDCIKLFEEQCERIFIKKDPRSLRIEKDGKLVWLSSFDVDFLISIGLRRLIELAWERKILVIGICKDTSASYLINNYIPILALYKVYDVDISIIPKILWTDRLLLERLSQTVDEIKAPWSTVEYDSCFMTLHFERTAEGKPKFEGDKPVIKGVKGYIVSPERVFLKSNVQLFCNPKKNVESHVFVVERLFYPEYDWPSNEKIEIYAGKAGLVTTRIFKDNNVENPVQDLIMTLLFHLCRNAIPESLGYPDPLFKADKIAKQYLKMVRKIIDSGQALQLLDPLLRSFRKVRSEYERMRSEANE